MTAVMDAMWWRAVLTGPFMRRWGAPVAMTLVPIIADLLLRSGAMPNMPATNSLGIETYAIGMFLVTMLVFFVWIACMVRSLVFAVRDTFSARTFQIGMGCSAYFAVWLPLLYVLRSYHARTSLALMAQQASAAYIGLGVMLVVFALRWIMSKLKARRYRLR